MHKAIAGIFVGAGALLLIYQGEYLAAGPLLGAMLGFFVGDTNGKRQQDR